MLGLKLARPEQPAVCVTSDGSFMMFPGAVATATEYDIPAVWVILNNYTIGVIRDLQRFYMDGREIGTSFVNYQLVAQREAELRSELDTAPLNKAL